ncbi:GTP cyclohydrolase II [Elasticomyces elasticus]|uniref:GTP cyclohydrolase II n=1 Tax=Exophiala sideris TaxID=1016849 RepID=A0A0D1W3F4_9EURO|nr:GTP cyclohydrolase II [Elasticomyces elasticus]KAK5040248.1 GTP cyclohydrolase II [Exophiala sideris]KAK5186224.1 GTP cyclohydrolase II [Eurotiomycetes sp. CCFEE 6388]KAK5043325.1 GTP cyclohydrolase II [Exophiala sideris]KAK5068626.1 GTP cyclohydrolase II [Exophiala sideris]
MAHPAEDLPSHASPMISPIPRPSAGYLSNWSDLHDGAPATPGIPDNLISPAFTPPATPGASTPSRHLHSEPKSIPVDTSLDDASTKQPRLVERLPNVECLVRARIPTTSGSEMFLYLYQNDSDNKEHLAIVFGNDIRSRSLDAERPGETEMDRMIRGAYVGRLRPGRTSSRIDPDKHRKPPNKRARSGSALKNVTMVPEEAVLEGDSATPVQPPPATQDEQNSEQPRGNETGLEPLLEAVEISSPGKAPFVRIHSECYTGETAWSARCDCGEQLDEAARLMSLPGSSGGVIVYLRQEGRGIGLASKLKAYNLQDLGNDTVEANLLLRHPADARTYGLATAILQDLGLGTDSDARKPEQERGIRLLTNNPDKVRAVEGPNKEVRVRERVAMIPIAWRTSGVKGVRGAEIEKYLETKIGRMGHMIHEE